VFSIIFGSQLMGYALMPVDNTGGTNAVLWSPPAILQYVLIFAGMIFAMFLGANDLKKGLMQIKILKGHPATRCIAVRIVGLTLIPYAVTLMMLFFGSIILSPLMFAVVLNAPEYLSHFTASVTTNVLITFYTVSTVSLISVTTYAFYYFTKNISLIFICMFMYISIISISGETPYPVSEKTIFELAYWLFFSIKYIDFVGFSEHMLVLSDRLNIHYLFLFTIGQVLQWIKIFLIYLVLCKGYKKKDLADILA